MPQNSLELRKLTESLASSSSAEYMLLVRLAKLRKVNASLGMKKKAKKISDNNDDNVHRYKSVDLQQMDNLWTADDKNASTYGFYNTTCIRLPILMYMYIKS